MVSEEGTERETGWSLFLFIVRAAPFHGREEQTKMSDTTNFQVSPKEIEALIEKAAKEPGLKDIAALIRLSEEVTQIDCIRAEMSAQPCFSQVTGTAGWLS